MKRLIRKTPILSAKNSKKKSRNNIQDHLIRCRSSNVWGYGFDIGDGQTTGVLYMQFKNNTGGPGDVYRYYDVPYQVYRKLVGTPSKGHYFWKAIRNKYKYSKLTGDKRGKLPNAVS